MAFSLNSLKLEKLLFSIQFTTHYSENSQGKQKLIFLEFRKFTYSLAKGVNLDNALELSINFILYKIK